MEGLIHGGAYFRNFTVSTILDKSPWDCTAIFIFFCHFSVPSKSSASFSKFSCSSPSPPPPTYTKLKLGKNLDTRVQHCLWDEGRGWTCVNYKTPQERKSVPRLFSMIVALLFFFFLIFFKLWDHCNWLTAVVVSLSN